MVQISTLETTPTSTTLAISPNSTPHQPVLPLPHPPPLLPPHPFLLQTLPVVISWYYRSLRRTEAAYSPTCTSKEFKSHDVMWIGQTGHQRGENLHNAVAKKTVVNISRGFKPKYHMRGQLCSGYAHMSSEAPHWIALKSHNVMWISQSWEGDRSPKKGNPYLTSC